jgi:hypothetical protein
MARCLRAAIALQKAAPMLEALSEVVARLDARDAALMIWGLSATAINLALIRAMAEANRRFEAFVEELARFNARFDAAGSAAPTQSRHSTEG